MVMQEIFDPTTQRVPIKAWAQEIEAGALEQARHLAQLPFAFQHVALMPDVHQGYGMPVGGVLAARDTIVPNAVGVDIGCGMIARRTSLRVEQVLAPHRGRGTVLTAALGAIMRAVPVGLRPGGSHKTAQVWNLPDEFAPVIEGAPVPLARAWERSAFQLGTLGSGNHFIEVQADEADRVWLMLHSGSRALGKAVCDHFNAEAVALNRGEGSSVPPAWQLAHLRTDAPLGRRYIQWMSLCLAYAEQNRALMMERVAGALESAAGAFAVEEAIQTHHNYAALERHFDQEVWVHRKGACRAREGELLIIPGSMETGSYIGRGLGSAESFQSCSHGAGRTMSRGAARKARTVQDMIESMNRKGIALATHKVESVLDEAGHAYKDVESVMAQEADLVEPVHRLRPLGVVKG
jgi:tRNA-splicing ligase RtcB